MQLEDFPMDAHACPLKFGSCKLYSHVKCCECVLGSNPHSFRIGLNLQVHGMGYGLSGDSECVLSFCMSSVPHEVVLGTSIVNQDKLVMCEDTEQSGMCTSAVKVFS